MPIHYTSKSIRQQYKNNKLKIIATTWHEEFQLPDGSYPVSDIQDYMEHIIKKGKTLATNPPIYSYISRINNRLVFKIADEYKLELQTPATMKLFDSTINLIDKTKNGEMEKLEVVEVVLVQCNLVGNQHQQKSEVIHTFTPNKSYDYLLNVEPT